MLCVCVCILVENERYCVLSSEFMANLNIICCMSAFEKWEKSHRIDASMHGNVGFFSVVLFILTDNFATWNRANERMNHHNFSTLLSESIDSPLPKLNVLNNVINMDAMPWIATSLSTSLPAFFCVYYRVFFPLYIMFNVWSACVCSLFPIETHRFLAFTQTDCSTYQK